ncbi:hypothetical protein FQN57_001169 [Myotisia sp. PD_48]|nr:hypothetical protein FQN57_001169 [Myotisia sp. PD_48]
MANAAVEMLADPVKEVEATNATDVAFERKVVRKCDLHVVPILFVLFLLSFLDRINIGNARLQGLEADLNMINHDYNLALFIFFIPYILCEVPSNLILKKIAPSTWLSSIIAAWGVTSSFRGLVACRFLLGVFEAGFVPGCIYLISMYYKRHELQKRINFFFSASIVAGAVSGFLAYAIAGMRGVGGYNGWRWIFIIEGIVTVVIAIASKFIIPDWPENAKFLNETERNILVSRLADDNGEAKMDRLDKAAFKRCFSDIKVYLGQVAVTQILRHFVLPGHLILPSILMYFGVVNSGYATSFFTPTILRQLGWTSLRAQVMSIPIFIVSTVITLTTAWISDRIRHRYAFTILGCCIATIGYVILICQKNVPIGARYFAVFAITSGAYITQPITMAWVSNNMAGHYKRSVSSSMQIGFGNTGGLVASNVFVNEEAPLYPTGFGTSLALLWICGISCSVFLFVLIKENRIRDAGGRNHRLNLPIEEVDNLGDDHPSFRFSY